MAWATAHNSVPSRVSWRPSSSCDLSWTALTIASLAARSQLASRSARNERRSSPVISAGVLRRNSRYFASSSPSSWLRSSRALLMIEIAVLLFFWKVSSMNCL